MAAFKTWKIAKPITLQRNILHKVTGISGINHYARNVYIKVFLKISVPCLLIPLKIFHQSINKLVGKYLQ